MATQARTRRMKTRLRLEPGYYVPATGETIIMQRELSGTYTAVTIGRISCVWEHPDEPGVTLMDVTVTMRDLPRGADVFLRPEPEQATPMESEA